MKRTTRLTFVSLLAALSLALGVAGIATATEPTVGGTLSVVGKTIEVYSNGNVPAHVLMSATDVTLSETTFDIQPGQTHSLTFSGPQAVGTVSALYTTVPVDGTESGSAQLSLNLTPGKVPAPSPFGAGLLSILLAAGLLFLLWRTKPWTYRVSLTRPQDPSA